MSRRVYFVLVRCCDCATRFPAQGGVAKSCRCPDCRAERSRTLRASREQRLHVAEVAAAPEPEPDSITPIRRSIPESMQIILDWQRTG